jgi:hypothetical protein
MGTRDLTKEYHCINIVLWLIINKTIHWCIQSAIVSEGMVHASYLVNFSRMECPLARRGGRRCEPRETLQFGLPWHSIEAGDE